MFLFLNNQYPFSYFIPYGRWNITILCWASTNAAFCCIGACSQFAQSKLTSSKTENRWARCELSASKEWANTEQAQPQQGHRKRAQVFECICNISIYIMLIHLMHVWIVLWCEHNGLCHMMTSLGSTIWVPSSPVSRCYPTSKRLQWLQTNMDNNGSNSRNVHQSYMP